MGVPGAAKASVARQAPTLQRGRLPAAWLPQRVGQCGSRPDAGATCHRGGAGGLERRGQVQPLPFVNGRPQPQGAGASLGPPGGKQGCRA